MIHKYICPASPMTCPVYKNAITAMQICIDDIRSWMEHDKLTSREMWTQRDQFSNHQLPLADDHLIALQHEQHLSNYPDSECSKGPLRNRHPSPLIDVGDLVYLHSDRNKSRARDRYLVVAIDPPFCDIKKFIGSQLRSSSYRPKLTECFKVPSDLADPLYAPWQCRGQDSDDEDDPDNHTSPPPSLPDIPDAISASAQHLSITPSCVTPPAPAFRADCIMEDTAAQPSCPEDPSLEKALVSADPDPPGLRRSSRTRRRPARFEDYDTEL